MTRKPNLSLRRAALGLAFAAGALFTSATPASAFSFSAGNLVVAFVKNGFDLVINAGAAPTGATGVNLDLGSALLSVPSQFGGTLAGATWTAFSVRSPDAQFSSDPADPLFGVPQNNYIATTNGNPSLVSFVNIGDGQAQLQPPNQGTAWFKLLTQVGAINGTSVLENSATRLVISEANNFFAGYGNVLGFGTNTIANTQPINTAGTVSQAVLGDALPLYEFLQTITLPNFDTGSQFASLGSLRLVPEPGTVLLLGAGLLGLAHFGHRRDA